METQIQMRDVSKLKPARYNPDTRTAPKNLKLLLNSMREYGFLPEFPIVIDRRGNVIDGHRRLACAKLLDIKRVPCVVSHIPAPKLWGRVTDTQRVMSPTEAGIAVLAGLNPPPEKHRRKIDEFKELVGEDTFRFVVESGFSYTSLNQAKSIARYCNKSTENGFVKKTIRWLIKYKMQYLVRSAITHNFATPRGLAERIEADEPLQVM